MTGNDEWRFGRVAILGLGLMGASLGLALREAAVAEVVAGYDRAPGVAARARERCAITDACASVEGAVGGADLVVLAVPVLAMRDVLAKIAPYLKHGALVTDLGSTKAQVLAWAAASVPGSAHFIGGHPMAGAERSGVEAALPALYRGCVWCLTPAPETPSEALAVLIRMAERLGARPLVLDAEAHDDAVAAISHLPLLAAVALTTVAADRADWGLAQRLAAGGFRDTTRVAAGDPRMARDICLTNREPLLAALDAYLAELRALRLLIAAGDAAVEARFAQAQRIRTDWTGAHPPDSAPHRPA